MQREVTDGRVFTGETLLEEELRQSYGIAGYIDVETTGLNPGSDEIIELALYLFAFQRETGEIKCIIDEYVGLREPKKPISRGAYMVHGIGKKDVEGQQLDLSRLAVMFNNAEFLIAHNAGFDRGFVTRLIPSCHSKPWLCSMRGVNWREKGMASVALQYLLKAHHIPVDKAHRAGSDVKAAIALLARSYNGRTYLYELLHPLRKAKEQASGIE